MLHIYQLHNCKIVLSPLETVSFPRLELQVVVLGARLANTFKKELNPEISGHYYLHIREL